MSAQALLTVTDLVVEYRLDGQAIATIGPIDLNIQANEIFGLVGESGGGKSTLSMAILGNLPEAAAITQGTILFDGHRLVPADGKAWKGVRWKSLAYVPQGAMNTLNPVRRIKHQFADLIKDHFNERLTARWRARIIDLLSTVNLKSDVIDHFPHELSGGMKQRVCIAMALIFDPKLIIADESTSALDVVSQRAVLETLSAARARYGTSIILIGHDLAIQAQAADRIGIMYAGQFVEIAGVKDIFGASAHPYTRRLIASVPSILHRTGIPDLAPVSDREKAQWAARTGKLIETGPSHLVRRMERTEHAV